jgi:fructokinase
MAQVTCFGEILWDIFPNHKKIGGAPLNVALRLHSFGIQTNIVSRIGNDNNGREILEYLKQKGLLEPSIQIDENFKTGCVEVTLDSKGAASYKIETTVAWDNIETNEMTEKLVRASDAFIFGSLACRSEKTKETLFKLLEYASYKVFDVNLRRPFYSMELLLDLMNKANLIKCNDDELNEICQSQNNKSVSLEEQIKFIAELTHTDQICVTRGKNGAVLYANRQYFYQGGYEVKVEDTVGAGDSFLAALVANLLEEEQLNYTLQFACAVGSLVASKKGANPDLSELEIVNFIKNQ